jgi:hypothetical protein
MKYTVVQIATLCRTKKFDWVLFAMGIYEAEWFVGYRNSFLPSKVAIWTPLDYIPQSIPQCNKFITMSPIPGIDGIIIGHGISRSLRRIPRQSAIRSIGSVGSWKGTFSMPTTTYPGSNYDSHSRLSAGSPTANCGFIPISGTQDSKHSSKNTKTSPID